MAPPLDPVVASEEQHSPVTHLEPRCLIGLRALDGATGGGDAGRPGAHDRLFVTWVHANEAVVTINMTLFMKRHSSGRRGEIGENSGEVGKVSE